MDTLRVEEVAALLRLNRKRVQTLARAGKLPASRVGRKWLFSRAKIEAMLGGQSPDRAHPGSGSECQESAPGSDRRHSR